jgi:predicted transporter
MNKLLDLRFVIGLFFLITGILLLLYSFFFSAAKTSDPGMINRWCGAIFILFGIFMLIISRKKTGQDDLTP